MRSVILWTLAILLMAGAVVYQRLTGPTHPFRGSFEVNGASHRYRLVRSEVTTTDAEVILPNPSLSVGAGLAGVIHYKRFKTDDPFTALEMAARVRDEEPELVAALPAQPPAGKLEYYLEVTLPSGPLRIPDAGEENVIIRFKDPVPDAILWSHIIFMFFSVLIGMRAGLAALFAPGGMRCLSWITIGGLTIGGTILGPIVQKYAFGKFWTGFPFGYDLTDNKLLIMWIVWLVACSTLGFKDRTRDDGKPKRAVGRIVVVAATVIMTVVYLIPHSMQGSELDYAKTDAGVPASEAIGTSDE